MSAAYPHSTVQCLTALAQHHGVAALPERLVHDFALDASEPDSRLVVRMATELGFKAQAVRLSWEDLTALEGVFPLIARRSDGHSVIVAGIPKQSAEGVTQLAILDPLAGTAIRLVGEAEFCAVWSGEAILVKRHHGLLDANQPFGLRWFIPEIMRQRSAFRDVAIAAVMLHMLGLGTDEFPAFYRRSSGLAVDARCYSPAEAAAAIETHIALGLPGGILVANPIPSEHELPSDLHDQALATALADAEVAGVRGRAMVALLARLDGAGAAKERAIARAWVR